MTATTDKGASADVDWRNPLRDKRDKRMPRIPGPCGVVIFGVTGDLATKKLMPAIYDLANRGLLPANVRPWSVSRDGIGPTRISASSSATPSERTPVRHTGRRCGTGWPRESGS